MTFATQFQRLRKCLNRLQGPQGLQSRSKHSMPSPTIQSVGKYNTKIVERAWPSIRPNYAKILTYSSLALGTWYASYLYLVNSLTMNSGQVQSVLSALRYDPETLDHLGQQIGFRNNFTYIKGTYFIRGGIIDIQFPVKGNKGDGIVKFHATRDHTGEKKWQVQKLQLDLPNGHTIDLTNRAKNSIEVSDLS